MPNYSLKGQYFMVDGTPRYVPQGVKGPEVTGFVNPFETPNVEGFAVFIKNVALVYTNGGPEVLSKLKNVMSPYGEKLAAIPGELVSIDYRYSLELGDIFSEALRFIDYDEDRLLFHQGLGDVLLDVVNNPEGLGDKGLSLVENLISSVFDINATELAPVLVDVISEKSLAGKTEDQRLGITTRAMSALMHFKDDPRVNTVIAEFLDSPDFPDARYIFKATTNLLSRDSSFVRVVVEKYSDRLIRVRNEAREQGSHYWGSMQLDLERWMEVVIEANPNPEILGKAQLIASI